MRVTTLKPKTAAVIRVLAAPSDGETLAVVARAARGGHTIRWLRDGKEFRRRDLPTSTICPTISADLERIAWAETGPQRDRLFVEAVAESRRRELIWWGEYERTLPPEEQEHEFRGRFAAIALSPDGTQCRVTEPNRQCFFGWALEEAFTGDDGNPLSHRNNTSSQTTFGNRLVYGPLILVGDEEGNTSVVGGGGGPECYIEGEDGAVEALALSPDGKRVCVSAGDGVTVWEHRGEVYDPLQRFRLTGHKGLVPGVAYNGDGTRILTTGADGTARLWDAVSGKNLHTWDWKSGPLTAAAFGPDGATALAGGKGAIIAWDLD